MPLSSGSLTSRRQFDPGEFVASLERQRHRPIRLCPFISGPGIPCGLRIGTADADYIYHEQGTTPYHQTHIACTSWRTCC
ncbi:MAG: hypothetical protein ACRDPF_36420 [Streptosporangiaceae bacterium]